MDYGHEETIPFFNLWRDLHVWIDFEALFLVEFTEVHRFGVNDE
jgi:hypothetical protein